jgi:hypothetical protein
MKPILIEAHIPKNVTLQIKKRPGYDTYYDVYIKGHWLRSWYGITINSVHSVEEALQVFAVAYYGHTVTTDTDKYPEEFL